MMAQLAEAFGDGASFSYNFLNNDDRTASMDVKILSLFARVSGLAGLAIGAALLLYRQIVGKDVFPALTKRDAYRLFRLVTILSFGLAALGVACWIWSKEISYRNRSDPALASAIPDGPLIIAGTIVDRSTNLGIGEATVSVEGQNSSSSTDDNGNFRIALPGITADPVRLAVTKDGYFTNSQSVTPPTHSLILQMRPK